MNNRTMSCNFLVFGLSVALLFQFVSLFIFAPVVECQSNPTANFKLIFLGSILKDQDFLFRPVSIWRTPHKVGSVFFGNSFALRVPGVVDKPFAIPQALRPLTQSPEAVIQKVYTVATSVSFGFSNYRDYLSGVDFSDLKRNALRDDLADSATLNVLLGDGGRVVDVKKVLGSGDPLFDFYCMLKFRNAIFKTLMKQKGLWVRVDFKIK